MRNITLLLFFVLLTSSVSAALLKGRVTDSAGETVAGASVYLEGNGFRHVTVTNMKGEYEFAGMKSGHYSLTGFHDRFSGQCQLISLEAQQNLEMNLTINRRTSNMEIRVKVESLDFDREDTVVASTSVVVNEDVNRDELVYHSAVGSILRDLPHGEYEVVLSAPGFAYVGAIEVVSDVQSEKTMVVHINGMAMHADDYLNASGAQVQAGSAGLITAQR